MSDDGRSRTSGAAEVKFHISAQLGETIRAWAREHLEADPHGGGTHGDLYRTTSLYFDTGALDTFHQRGGYRRSKHRVRRYGESNDVMLERKTKTRGLITKRRTAVALGELDRLRPGLRMLETGTPWAGAWFASRIAQRQLRPVCQITYERTARIALAANGPIRLTIDDHVQALMQQDMALRDSVGARIGAPNVILELKYRGEAPPLFKALIEEFALNPDKVSKYRLAVAALGIASEDGAECRAS